MSAHRRLFVGIPLSQEVQEATAPVKKSLIGTSGIRWTPDEHLHVTLLFIGKVDTRALQPIRVHVEDVALSCTSFILQLKTFTFMPFKRPRMIWALFESRDAFTAFSVELRQHLEAWLEEPVSHEPRPHATLARFKYLPASLRAPLPHCPPMKMRVDSIILYESHLSSEGSRYEALQEFELAS